MGNRLIILFFLFLVGCSSAQTEKSIDSVPAFEYKETRDANTIIPAPPMPELSSPPMQELSTPPNTLGTDITTPAPTGYIAYCKKYPLTEECSK